MTYTGHVTPGGPTDVRQLDRATIRKLSVSEMHNNVYLLTCRPPASSCSSTPPTTRTAASCSCARAPAGSTTWSPPTSTGTTSGRSRRSPAPPAPRRTPGPTTPTRCPWRPTCGWQHGDVVDRRRARARRASTCAGTPPARSRCPGRDPDGGTAPVHRRLALPRRRGQHQEPRAELRVAVRRRRRARLRPATTTTPGSTPATATTRRSAPSARTCRSGATAAGEVSAAHREARSVHGPVHRPVRQW